MAAGSIVIDLLMRTGSFETDTKRAEARLKALGKEAKQVGAAIGAAFGAAAVATAYFVKSQIDAADAATDAAQAVGLSVEAFTSLAYAADFGAVSQEELSGALVKLSKTAVDAAGGSKTAAAGFDALGVSVKNADGSIKDVDALLSELAGKFAGYADGTAKTALATEFFGRAGAKLVPVLNLGADGIANLRKEFAEFGLVLDTETSEAAGKFNDNLGRVTFLVNGFAKLIAAEALPALNDTALILLDVVRNQDAMATGASAAASVLGGLINVFQVVAVVGSDLIFVLKGTGREIGALAAQAAALARLDLRGFRAISDAVKEDAARARAELDAFQARIMSIGRSGGRGALGQALGADSAMLNPRLPSAPTLPSGGSGSAAKAAADKAAQYLETLRKQLQGTKDLSVEEALLADIQAGRLGKVLPAQEAELRGIARLIDAANASEKAARDAMKVAEERSDARNREDKQIEESILAAQEADAVRLKSLTSGTSSEQLKAVTSDIEFLNQAYRDGAIDVGTWAEAVTQATQRLKSQGEEMDQFTKTMAENVQSFLGSAFAEAMDGNFKNIGKSFTQMINRMVAEALAADLARRLFGAAGGGSGGGWVGLASQFIGSMFGGGKAGGGDVMPGREYWVGENGPERFRPRTMGTIIPASPGGTQKNITNTLNVNVNAQQGMSRQSAMQQGEAIGRGIQLAMARNG